MDVSQTYGVRLLAFTILEGVLFSHILLNLLVENEEFMPRIDLFQRTTARDEALHATFGVEMFNMLKDRPSDDKIREVLNEAITLEMNLLTRFYRKNCPESTLRRHYT